MALEYSQVFHRFEPIRNPVVGLFDDGVLARLDLFHIDLDRPVDGDTEIAATPRHVRGPRACDQSLGWDTADIDAGAAK